jgi:hypothetical protein
MNSRHTIIINKQQSSTMKRSSRLDRTTSVRGSLESLTNGGEQSQVISRIRLRRSVASATPSPSTSDDSLSGPLQRLAFASSSSSPLTEAEDETTKSEGSYWGYFVNEEERSLDQMNMFMPVPQRRLNSIFEQIQGGKQTMSPKSMGWTSVPL